MSTKSSFNPKSALDILTQAKYWKKGKKFDGV
jgi:hypothetical protein